MSDGAVDEPLAVKLVNAVERLTLPELQTLLARASEELRDHWIELENLLDELDTTADGLSCADMVDHVKDAETLARLAAGQLEGAQAVIEAYFAEAPS